MKHKKLLQSLVFFIIGISIFIYVYKDFNVRELRTVLNDLNYNWIYLSIVFSLLSHLVRALRWKMLIHPLNYKPATINLFLAVLILYFINLIIPRGGEIARCGVINKYERIPFTKLLGTVLVERISDLIAFFLIVVLVFIGQFSFLKTFIGASEFSVDLVRLKNKISLILVVIVFLVVLFFGLKKLGILKRFGGFLKRIRIDFIEGFTSIVSMKRKGLFVFYTLLIFLFWLLMLYVVFFAYPPTENLTFKIAILIYTIGTFAYLLPIQAGIGAWHFLIIQCLFLFGIDKEFGMVFALIAHTFTNLVYLVFGTIGFMILPIINNTGIKSGETN